MASIGCYGKGNRCKRILVVCADGKRRTLRLGPATMKQVEAFSVKVGQLETASITGVMDGETARWIAGLDDTMYARIAAVGLVKARGRTRTTLGSLLSEFFAALNVKSSTEITYRQTQKSLLAFFGETRALVDISPLDADKWRQGMKAQGLSQPTISKRVKTARQIFKQAIRWKMLTDNPFSDLKAGAQTNKSRMFYVTRQMADAVIAACPDAEWRLIFALSRYGGLRCPSEHLAMRWEDVNFETDRIVIRSSKTEHYVGGESRVIPLFPELRPHLLEVFEQAEPGSEFVISRYRDTNSNLRTQLFRIIKRAGLTPWPKLFHNLRSTRQTELSKTWAEHIVCAWLGNSERIAYDHYLQVTEADYERAVADARAEQAAQNAAQQSAAGSGKGAQAAHPSNENRPEIPGDSASCDSLQGGELTPTGFEPVSRP
jgi:integrase